MNKELCIRQSFACLPIDVSVELNYIWLKRLILKKILWITAMSKCNYTVITFYCLRNADFMGIYWLNFVQDVPNSSHGFRRLQNVGIDLNSAIQDGFGIVVTAFASRSVNTLKHFCICFVTCCSLPVFLLLVHGWTGNIIMFKGVLWMIFPHQN